jgi:uncharacterized membrane protein
MRSLELLAMLFCGAGLTHFFAPAFFVRIVPPYLSHAELLVALSGVAEVAGGLGLLLPLTRRWAGLGLIALLVAVFPANIYMLQLALRDGSSGLWQAGLWARLPVQGLLIWFIWRVSQPRTRTDSQSAEHAPPAG